MKRIYVHGLGQTPASWEKTLLYLNDGEENVCLDLAGMLRGKEANYQNLYQAFCALCDETGSPVDLCGLSLGGVLSLNYAADHPENVRSLVLIAPQYRMPKKLLRVQNTLFRFMPGSMFRQTGFGKRELIQLCGSMAELDFSASLHKITCMVLVVCGQRDRANGTAAGKLAGMLSHAELRIVGGAGHEVNVDAPEQLAALLAEFYG